jgi:hypothetical protein
VEDVDLADAQFMKFLADQYETGKFGESSKGEGSVGQAIFVLAKGGSTSYEEKKNQDSVISLNLRINELMNQSYNFDHKLKHKWDLSSKTKTASARAAMACRKNAGGGGGGGEGKKQVLSNPTKNDAVSVLFKFIYFNQTWAFS